MPSFGKASKSRLATLHPKIQSVLNEAIKYYNFSIVCGHRNEKDQNQAYDDRLSTKRWPNSRHNTLPSEAVDVAPYPIDWNNDEEFCFLAGLITGIAETMGIKLRWGGRWESLNDLPHLELE